jgi:hypothetical protein
VLLEEIEKVPDAAVENGVGIVYVNLVGGQDEIVFDGGSFIVDPEGRLLFQGPRFEEGLFTVDLESLRPMKTGDEDEIAQIERAIVLGIRDYMRKNGFDSALVGLSVQAGPIFKIGPVSQFTDSRAAPAAGGCGTQPPLSRPKSRRRLGSSRC